MIPHFDLEQELANNATREITEDSLPKLRFLIEPLLEGLGVPTPLAVYKKMVQGVIRTRCPILTEMMPLPPTVDSLVALPHEYFGRSIEIENIYGVGVPFSLARVKDKVYIRCHMSEKEVEEKIRLRC